MNYILLLLLLIFVDFHQKLKKNTTYISMYDVTLMWRTTRIVLIPEWRYTTDILPTEHAAMACRSVIHRVSGYHTYMGKKNNKGGVPQGNNNVEVTTTCL